MADKGSEGIKGLLEGCLEELVGLQSHRDSDEICHNTELTDVVQLAIVCQNGKRAAEGEIGPKARSLLQRG